MLSAYLNTLDDLSAPDVSELVPMQSFVLGQQHHSKILFVCRLNHRVIFSAIDRDGVCVFFSHHDTPFSLVYAVNELAAEIAASISVKLSSPQSSSAFM